MRLYRFLTGPDDAAFCHRVTAALNAGWELAGPATMTFDSALGRVICGQSIVKDVPGTDYEPSMKLSDY
ncbi:DUF1737 domain-containing protein [Methylobrevis albus]|uniref:DUF1737 domain-containing protein n=1 Tax=Methylobrevis albus TaxID=2793297 RepID=A0A931I216_9HYPH|nr:DUF1737 domain-containing protein [Methylobrevis albus]MBH0238817.1 DUF1737 domain-containing protein [Methylobrevis albus]